MPAGALAAETRESVCAKYKDVFALRNRLDEGAVPALIALFEGTPSVLLRHEIAYALGQMQRGDAVPFLSRLLTDAAEHPITRHEAAEALGAIADPASLALLREHAADGAEEVAQTCALALARLDFHIAKGSCGCEKRPLEVLRLERERERAPAGEPPARAAERPASPADGPSSIYNYVDPAPPADAAPVATLRARLLDAALPLFERYRALFALRDAVPKDGDAAVEAVASAFGSDCALFKHEAAFVLGQLEELAAVPALVAVLRREDEHPMVRHEAAEALGAIGSAEAMEVLREHGEHEVEILRESCWVALHMYDREAFLASGVCV